MLVLALCAMLAGVPGFASAAITTTTTLDSSVTAATGDVRLGALVAACPPVSGAPTPTGTVQLFEGATLVATLPLSLPGPPPQAGPCAVPYDYRSNFAITTLPAVGFGTHTYTAVYSGDAYYAPSTSSATVVVVPPRPASIATTTTLDSSVTAATGDVRLGALVAACPSSSGAPTPIGTVQIFEGATLIATLTLPTLGPPPQAGPCASPYDYRSNFANTTLPAVAVGTHTYTAVYSGDAYYAPSTSAAIVVVVPPRPASITSTTTLDSSVIAATGDVRLDVLIAACPSSSGAPTPIGTVQIFDGATLIATLTLPTLGPPPQAGPCAVPYDYRSNFANTTLRAVSIGTHTYTAVYSGDAYYAPSTSAAIVVVVPPRPASLVTTTVLSGTADPITGDVRLGVVVAPCPVVLGAPVPVGTVQIFEGTTLVTTLTLSPLGSSPGPGPCAGPYTWNFAPHTITGASPGTHTYQAVYSGDAYFAGSTSANVAVVVPPRPALLPTTAVLSGSADPITGDVRLGVIVAPCPVVVGAPLPLGSVRIYDGATLVTTLTLSPIGSSPGQGPCAGPYTWNFAPYTITGASPGTHTYSAVYSGDAYFATSTSAPVTINVTALPPVPPGQSFGGPTSTLSGNATVQVSGGGPLCGFTRAAFLPVTGDPNSPPPGSAPPGLSFPHGLVGFVTSGCTPGSTLAFTMTFPAGSSVPTAYWKYGPTPGNATPHWYQMPASILGNVVTFSIVDGGLGDDDLTANGTIVDAGGPTADSAQIVPALSEWGRAVLILLVAWMGFVALGRTI